MLSGREGDPRIRHDHYRKLEYFFLSRCISVRRNHADRADIDNMLTGIEPRIALTIRADYPDSTQ